jgi:hypothetical protein
MLYKAYLHWWAIVDHECCPLTFPPTLQDKVGIIKSSFACHQTFNWRMKFGGFCWAMKSFGQDFFTHST